MCPPPSGSTFPRQGVASARPLRPSTYFCEFERVATAARNVVDQSPLPARGRRRCRLPCGTAWRSLRAQMTKATTWIIGSWRHKSTLLAPNLRRCSGACSRGRRGPRIALGGNCRPHRRPSPPRRRARGGRHRCTRVNITCRCYGDINLLLNLKKNFAALKRYYGGRVLVFVMGAFA